MNYSENLANIPQTPLLIRDYLNKNQKIEFAYHLFPTSENIIKQTGDKLNHYTHREILVKEISNQMNDLELSQKQIEHLKNLQQDNAVTITTGHQLNLLTGPIYFVYKILQTIKLSDEMNARKTGHHFVPIFWMATEDHDFQEINHFELFNKIYTWEREPEGAVGRMNLDGIHKVFNELYEDLKDKFEINFLKEFIENSYYQSKNLAEATKKLVHLLFKEFGILILNGDSKILKQLMIPYFKEELRHNTSYKFIDNQAHKLKELGYKIQVNPRDINLFYLSDKTRKRIIKKNDIYLLDESDKTWTEVEIITELENYPERFSPNALLRPFYQEVILPNVVYIGGNAEIAYWLELKSYFDHMQINFPIIIPRNSVFILNAKHEKKMKKLNWKPADFFLPKQQLINQYFSSQTPLKIDFAQDKFTIQQLYQHYKQEAEKTDITLLNLLNAQEIRQLKAFDALEKRLIKAEKRIYTEKLNQWNLLYACIFPKNNWQERSKNVFDWYIFERKLLTIIYEKLNGIEPEIHLISV